MRAGAQSLVGLWNFGCEQQLLAAAGADLCRRRFVDFCPGADMCKSMDSFKQAMYIARFLGDDPVGVLSNFMSCRV